MKTWLDLEFWGSSEWADIQNRLINLDKKGVRYNPPREFMFANLELCPYHRTKVMILGQDPYPKHRDATGVAFSTDGQLTPTLINILKEYCTDLHYQIPRTGNLTKWAEQGVLLWNSIVSCEEYKSLSHQDWPWHKLTREIIEKLNERKIVFVFLGGVAREFAQFVNRDLSDVIETSHPSPRASAKSRVPFQGSRVFSTINAKIATKGIDHPINWQL